MNVPNYPVALLKSGVTLVLIFYEPANSGVTLTFACCEPAMFVLKVLGDFENRLTFGDF